MLSYLRRWGKCLTSWYRIKRGLASPVFKQDEKSVSYNKYLKKKKKTTLSYTIDNDKYGAMFCVEQNDKQCLCNAIQKQEKIICNNRTASNAIIG